MSKLARERKKHWRVVKAIAKEQSIAILEPKKPSRGFWKYWEELYSIPFISFQPPIITEEEAEESGIRGLNINGFWYDELGEEDDKNKSN
jgi:hypothetical protein